MVKKILLGSLLAGLVGVLIFGAVNRTAAKSGERLSSAENRLALGEGFYGEGNGSGSGGGGGQGRGSAYARSMGGNVQEKLGIPDPQADAGQWEMQQGTVASLDNVALVLNLQDGSQLFIEGRAWAYALEQNYTTAVGNTLQVNGFHEDGEFKPAGIEDLTAGTSIVLRDQNGRPMWAGRGWGSASSGSL